MLGSVRTLFFCCVACVGSGCQNYGGLLQRGQGYYEDNRYELALAVFRQLEPDQDSLDAPERVRYYYLRGMTDYRLGYVSHARYWLGLAQASEQRARGSLNEDERGRLDKTLANINRAVFGLESAKGRPAQQRLGEPCEWTSECDSGFVCEDSMCVHAE